MRDSFTILRMNMFKGEEKSRARVILAERSWRRWLVRRVASAQDKRPCVARRTSPFKSEI